MQHQIGIRRPNHLQAAVRRAQTKIHVLEIPAKCWSSKPPNSRNTSVRTAKQSDETAAQFRCRKARLKKPGCPRGIPACAAAAIPPSPRMNPPCRKIPSADQSRAPTTPTSGRLTWLIISRNHSLPVASTPASRNNNMSAVARQRRDCSSARGSRRNHLAARSRRAFPASQNRHPPRHQSR